MYFFKVFERSKNQENSLAKHIKYMTNSMLCVLLSLLLEFFSPGRLDLLSFFISVLVMLFCQSGRPSRASMYICMIIN
ncbi:hypothetical protein K1719_018355 [Acacia pycnantha]|nr:hypothetical protein K1719_018355 [Acacia pycnantha]